MLKISPGMSIAQKATRCLKGDCDKRHPKDYLLHRQWPEKKPLETSMLSMFFS